MQDAIAIVAAVSGASALLLNCVLFVRSGLWRSENKFSKAIEEAIAQRVGQMEGRIMALIADNREHDADLVEAMRREMEDRLDGRGREFGEIANALRTKIHELELWSRDQFVRRDSFREHLSRLESTIERSDAKIDQIQAAIGRIAAHAGVAPPTRLGELP